MPHKAEQGNTGTLGYGDMFNREFSCRGQISFSLSFFILVIERHIFLAKSEVYYGKL
jgi:hypothetical protein